jgi:hypothetical protein
VDGIGGGHTDRISIYNIVLDHLSLSGSYDGRLGIFRDNYDITVQNCIISSNEETPYSVDEYVQITASSAADALTYVKANAGCRVGGLDTFDQAIIDAMV